MTDEEEFERQVRAEYLSGTHAASFTSAVNRLAIHSVRLTDEDRELVLSYIRTLETKLTNEKNITNPTDPGQNAS